MDYVAMPPGKRIGLPLNCHPPPPPSLQLGPVYMRPGRCQTGMKIEIVSMFT